MGDDNPHSFAQKCNFQDSVMRRYMKGSLPRMDKLVTIAKTAGVNIEWLANGQGPMRPGESLGTNEAHPDYHTGPDRRLLEHGRRRTDLPMSKTLRRVVEGLLYLEKEDPDGFTLLSGKIIEREEKAREFEELKKIGNTDA